MTIPRRAFIAGATAVAASSYQRILGANDRVSMGLIGAGERGRYVMSVFLKNPGVQLVSVCDIWGDQIDKAKEMAPAAQGFSDHRELLDSKDVDAVLVATPDHWHVPILLDAAQAGKDIYIEKPLTKTPEEGPQAVKAVRENNRICQVGMQQRSGKHYLEAKSRYIDAGRLGRITLARTWWHGNGYHLRRAPASLANKPANLDWTRFQGNLKWRDWDPQQYWNWRAYLDYGGGQITDLFTHWIDVVHMFMNEDGPTSAVAEGGIYAYPDGRTAPDTINVLLQYPTKPFTATFEATLAPGIRGYGIEMCGTGGRLLIDREHYEFHAAEKGAEPVIVNADRRTLEQDHVANFLDCLRTRNLPNGDVQIGHRSAQASHLGNIAYLQRRRIDFDPQREEILPL